MGDEKLRKNGIIPLFKENINWATLGDLFSKSYAWVWRWLSFIINILSGMCHRVLSDYLQMKKMKTDHYILKKIIKTYTCIKTEDIYIYSSNWIFPPGNSSISDTSTHSHCPSALTYSGKGIKRSRYWMKFLSSCVFLEGNREQKSTNTKCFYSDFPEGL